MSTKNELLEKDEPIVLDVLLLAKIRDNQQKKGQLNSEIVNHVKTEYQLKKSKEQIDIAMDSIYGEEHNLLKQIEQTYGKVNIDLETGILTPMEQ